ncbi:hypothetical protein L228DRAFT_253632 [Xylona heveae TC161]|uniref:Uncharacterized protein n=1 Tax=Xylona heveae (strain CBS 132557 / TC161) TaxID=1328760 RepID=A0A165FK12_XYLHT|nr:hypothetical protein L228DRAFT_253632 [Xylona heveae TC161]KZF21067.1 hypothetical protein L228DRAFT_253632 [Xylona heveae TC161]
MPVERRLLRESITLSQALDREVNVLHQLGYWPQRNELLYFLHARRKLIESRVAHHLKVPVKKCQTEDVGEWMNGSFNICVPVRVEGLGRVIIRFPLPYRVGESFCPGNGDEKVRCEAGTYAWMQEFCPSIPIPRFYGFAVRSGQSFTALDRLPLVRRLLHRIHCWYSSLFGNPLPSRLVPDDSDASNELGPYLIIEYIEEGRMLSDTWANQRNDKTLRKNLFRDLSKVMLTMSRIALPKIGSFIIDDNGYLRLANRPLTLMLQDLENENIPVDMPRSQTIASVDSYVNSLLMCHDSRLRSQPNAVKSYGDCARQLTALALMRTVRPQFLDHQFNHGPFVFTLTDLHASNILVDKDWHIKRFIDLEWASSLPIEFMRTPLWLTSQGIDQTNTEEYDEQRQEFMEIFKEEEKNSPPEYDFSPASIMERCWKSGAFWYRAALMSPTGLYNVFLNHIQPLFSDKHADDVNFYLIVSQYWARGTADFIQSRVDDKEAYDSRLREMFKEP